MRCTRCDGLAVPQAVGLDPDGRVIFGWCRSCLAEARCRLVEVPSTGLVHLKVSAPAGPARRADRRTLYTRNDPAGRVDDSQWIVAIVALLMIGWGLILVAAGFFAGSRPASGSSPLGNGTAPLLGVGGAATTLLGLGLLVLASRRN